MFPQVFFDNSMHFYAIIPLVGQTFTCFSWFFYGSSMPPLALRCGADPSTTEAGHGDRLAGNPLTCGHGNHQGKDMGTSGNSIHTGVIYIYTHLI